MTDTDTPKRFLWKIPYTTGLAIIAVLALAMAAVAFVAVLITGQGAQEQAKAVAQDTAPTVLTLDVLCGRNDDLAKQLREHAACGESLDKAKTAVAGQPQPQVVSQGMTRDDVIAIVTAQIAGKSVTVDEVMAMVVKVYNSNKPAAGKDAPAPTADQVLAAVQSVCGSTKCQGPKGDDAPPASNADIFAQVKAFCSGDDAPCKGEPGIQGVQGIQGATGPPGPVCDDQHHSAEVTAGLPPVTFLACVDN